MLQWNAVEVVRRWRDGQNTAWNVSSRARLLVEFPDPEKKIYLKFDYAVR